MHKLLSRSSSGPSLFSTPAKATSFLSLPSKSTSLSFTATRRKPSSSSGGVSAASFPLPVSNAINRNIFFSPPSRNLETIMPSATANFQFRPFISVSADSRSTKLAPSSARLVCRCLVNGTAITVRPWVALKCIRSGSRLAWLHTVAAGESAAVPVAESSSVLQNEDALLQEKGAKPEDKPVKFQRRTRANSAAMVSGLQVCPDLLTIPGVGPRNLRKLVDNGIEGVAELKQLYKDRFSGKSSQKMVEYLQSDVGIIHRTHAESITTFIKETVDEELKDDGSSSDVMQRKKRITLCVEGNISVGKTTFLQRIANETLELSDLVEVIPEPIDKWQNVGPDHLNLLDAFYAEPKRYAYTFQNYVFVTRVMQERESSGGIKPLRLMERSVFSDRMVFVRAVHEAKWMNEMEINIYDSWFDPVISSLPGLIPDGFIYLRASPDTCYKRMMHRKREEEGGVSLDYLRDLHEKHESWLFPSESGSHGVLTVNQLPPSIDSSLHPAIKDRVFLLEGSHMHPSIQKVPALVLDCEPNIDFSRDIEAKQHYARQVAEFFQFVKMKKRVLESPKDGEEAKNNVRQLIHPSQGTPLWVPDDKNLQHLSLESLGLGNSMSSFLSC